MFLKKFAPPRRAVLEASVGLGLLLAVLLTCRFSSFAAVAASVRADTLRLHVQANSNGPDDQLLKFRVRDAVLETAGPACPRSRWRRKKRWPRRAAACRCGCM